mmetsp:Transcript_6030/g.7165  ORF Transcript_6030/g.7165 Transcript_6030/m.7165 type:complete len:343 (+) Transcript_6030:87-1115(+)
MEATEFFGSSFVLGEIMKLLTINDTLTLVQSSRELKIIISSGACLTIYRRMIFANKLKLVAITNSKVTLAIVGNFWWTLTSPPEDSKLILCSEGASETRRVVLTAVTFQNNRVYVYNYDAGKNNWIFARLVGTASSGAVVAAVQIQDIIILLHSDGTFKKPFHLKRNNAALAIFNGELFIFGGVNRVGVHKFDAWALRIDNTSKNRKQRRNNCGQTTSTKAPILRELQPFGHHSLRPKSPIATFAVVKSNKIAIFFTKDREMTYSGRFSSFRVLEYNIQLDSYKVHFVDLVLGPQDCFPIGWRCEFGPMWPTRGQSVLDLWSKIQTTKKYEINFYYSYFESS